MGELFLAAEAIPSNATSISSVELVVSGVRVVVAMLGKRLKAPFGQSLARHCNVSCREVTCHTFTNQSISQWISNTQIIDEVFALHLQWHSFTISS